MKGQLSLFDIAPEIIPQRRAFKPTASINRETT